MSELNVYHHELRPNEYAEFYLKYEADKAIAELKESHKMEVEQLLIEIAELKADYREACDRLQTANLIKDEQLAATRHHKYKRCLAMAELCQYRSEMFFTWSKKMGFLLKWQNRWHELAKKFKEEAK